MRIAPTSPVIRADRVQLGRPATMRDPSRAPVDVVVRDLSLTGALLEAEAGADLPVGTLVSLGIAGAGMQMARVVRDTPGGVAVEFMLPLDPRALAATQRARTVVSVAIPQLPIPLRAGFVADSGNAMRGAAGTRAVLDPDGDGLRYSGWLPLLIGLGLLLLYLAI
ncbi:PilZ domain-containing protein [Sphingomonas sp.]|uniref:PilZ domain-containing protein n=1 Tax=Sphingomonas sp. TaxID=28214 RepID=UPI003B00E827